ncbi:hyaluronan-mediated motility receptor-like isoform X2 [Hetaerina americana]|uniref:hyaluronan-mediated motility receptor-like isoform X2 n=2 Tax=Hetaerina americana TaxID=62018 RepID=UPI003A7F5DDE
MTRESFLAASTGASASPKLKVARNLLRHAAPNHLTSRLMNVLVGESASSSPGATINPRQPYYLSVHSTGSQRGTYESEMVNEDNSCSSSFENETHKSVPIRSCVHCAILRKEVAEHIASIRKLSTKVKGKNKKLYGETRTLQKISEIVQQFSEYIPAYEDRYTEARAINSNLGSLVARLRGETSGQRTKFCTMKETIDKLNALRNHMAMQISHLEKECDNKNSDLSLCKVQAELADKSILEKADENKILKEKILLISKKLEESEDLVEKNTIGLFTSLQELKKKEEENDNLHLKLKQARDEHDVLVKVVEEQYKQVIAYVCMLKENYDKKEQELLNLSKEINVMKVDNDNVKEKYLLLMKCTAENLGEIVKEVKLNCGLGQSESPGNSASIGSQDSECETENLIQQYMNHLKVALGGLAGREILHNEVKSSLERELIAKNEEINNLHTLIGPFREQLELYEHERQALSDITRETKSELEKISLQQAASLGHQNHKQKIRYLVKLKEHNLRLKNEVMELEATIRQKDRVITQLRRKKSDSIGA